MSNDTESIKAIIVRISNTLSGKGGEYKESVISVLPRGDWLSQIVIKANRAQRAVSDEKLKDELLDTACYCILLLDKIERESVKSGPSGASREIDRITEKTVNMI